MLKKSRYNPKLNFEALEFIAFHEIANFWYPLPIRVEF